MIKNRILLFITIVFANSCSSSINDISSNERVKLVDIGGSVAQAFQKDLFRHLSEAIGDGGAPNAISVCNLEALEITKAAQRGFPQSLEIKRVSFKFRNAKNAPDKYEAEALNYLATPQKGDAYPINTVQKINFGKETVFRFYKPMRMAEMCLQCHGSDKQISDVVAEKLTELYPNDLAVDYKRGDFRGAIRIQISKEDLLK
ncbi:MAG: DUF3365 domain-containing protein [Candidatus Marinimicrobia bacterium]|nr:DUF3365 domain-containing protein [Candidatus Neomarinimicrobiota bacterium]